MHAMKHINLISVNACCQLDIIYFTMPCRAMHIRCNKIRDFPHTCLITWQTAQPFSVVLLDLIILYLQNMLKLICFSFYFKWLLLLVFAAAFHCTMWFCGKWEERATFTCFMLNCFWGKSPKHEWMKFEEGGKSLRREMNEDEKVNYCDGMRWSTVLWTIMPATTAAIATKMPIKPTPIIIND